MNVKELKAILDNLIEQGKGEMEVYTSRESDGVTVIHYVDFATAKKTGAFDDEILAIGAD